MLWSSREVVGVAFDARVVVKPVMVVMVVVVVADGLCGSLRAFLRRFRLPSWILRLLNARDDIPIRLECLRDYTS